MPYDNRAIYSISSFDGGYCSGYPKHTLEADESPNTENFDPSVPYVLQKRLGQSNFTGDHGTPTGTAVRGLGIFTFDDGTVKRLAKEGTAVYDITAGNWSTTVTGHPALSDADEVHFTMFTNFIIMTSEEASPIAPQKWTGSGAWASLGGSPPAAKYSCVHKGRLILACTSADKSRLYGSALNNSEDWSTADNAFDIYVAKSDGMGINGVASDGEVLYVSKLAPSGNEGAIYAIYGDGPADLKPPRRIAWFGATGHRGMCITHSFVAAATHRGIFGLQGNRVVYLNDAFNKDWMALTTAQRREACLGFYKNQLWVAYPDTGSTNTKAFVCDLFYQRWSLYNWGATAKAPRIFATDPDGSLYGAGASTSIRVIKFDTGATDIGSTAITMFWETPNIDFGQYFTDKRSMQSALHVDSSQTITWTIQRAFDNAAFTDSQTMASNTDGPVKRFLGLGSSPSFRHVRFKISEADTSASGRLFGLELEAEIMPRTR
jgi:hypothetical protein